VTDGANAKGGKGKRKKLGSKDVPLDLRSWEEALRKYGLSLTLRGEKKGEEPKKSFNTPVGKKNSVLRTRDVSDCPLAWRGQTFGDLRQLRARKE